MSDAFTQIAKSIIEELREAVDEKTQEVLNDFRYHDDHLYVIAEIQRLGKEVEGPIGVAFDKAADILLLSVQHKLVLVDTVRMYLHATVQVFRKVQLRYAATASAFEKEFLNLIGWKFWREDH